MGKLHVFYPPAEQSATQIGIGRETAEFLGMDPNSNPTVDEALIAAVLTAGNACRVNVTVTVGGKAAKAGIQVNGIKTLTGGVCYTDGAGKVMGLATQPATTLSTPAYVDLPAVSKSVATPAQGTVSATLALAAPVNNTVKTYTSTCTVVFSPYVTGVDVCCIGAGGKGGRGGSGGDQTRPSNYGAYFQDGTGGGGGGAGGGSGQAVSSTGVTVSAKQEYDITVGKDGSSSSALGLTAMGGVTGANGYNGADADGHGINRNGGPGGTAGAAVSGGARGGNGGAGGAGMACSLIPEPTTSIGDRGNDGTKGGAGGTVSVPYWGGTITLTGGNGGSGGGGGGGGAGVHCANAQDHGGYAGQSGVGGTTTTGGTGGLKVSGTYTSSRGTSSFTSGAGGNGGAPVTASESCGGGSGGSGAAAIGKDGVSLGIYEGGKGGTGGNFTSQTATMGCGGNGGGGGGGNGANLIFEPTSGSKRWNGGGMGLGQSTVGTVLIRVHTAQ